MFNIESLYCILLNKIKSNQKIPLDSHNDHNQIPNGQWQSGAPNSAKFRGVAEGHPRFDKGGVAIIFYFLRVKNRTF